MITRTGRCLCGAVAFEADLTELGYHACHCGMCRRWAGGPNFAIAVEALRITAGAERVVTFRSSDWAERSHCGTCGSNLWYRLRDGGRHIPSVGAFDDMSDMVLTTEIYTDHQPAGYAFAGTLKRMTEAEVIGAFAPPAD